MATTITYNGSTISSIEANKTAILKCAGKVANTDIVIAPTDDNASVSYDGNVIASLTGGQTATLKCANKLTKTDISIVTESAMATLSTPEIEIDGTTLNIYDEEGLATSYDILVDGAVMDTVALPTGKISVGGDWYDTIVIPASWIGSTWESKLGQVLEGEAYSWTISVNVAGVVDITPGSHYTSGSLTYLDDAVRGSDTIAAVEYETDVYYN